MFQKFAVIAFLLISNYCIPLSAQTDSLSSPEAKSEDYPIYAIGGIGMTTGSTFIFWKDEFNTGPAISLGFEAPFTKAHIFSFQLYSHYWVGKKKIEEVSPKWVDDYIKVSEEYYSQIGVSALIKFYIGSLTDRFRLSLHLGCIFYSVNPEYRGIDFGFGAYYKLNENLILELSRRMNTGRVDFIGNSTGVPNMLLLNVYYKI